jgi:hypothetical protein
MPFVTLGFHVATQPGIAKHNLITPTIAKNNTGITTDVDFLVIPNLHKKYTNGNT